ncbi:hypothetical protein BDR04DRAFT_1143560 [Suillus decipiens]|nr:hypothetical protein BDR04DRAFT_1143560 [Suillus decipiens]
MANRLMLCLTQLGVGRVGIGIVGTIKGTAVHVQIQNKEQKSPEDEPECIGFSDSGIIDPTSHHTRITGGSALAIDQTPQWKQDFNDMIEQETFTDLLYLPRLGYDHRVHTGRLVIGSG